MRSQQFCSFGSRKIQLVGLVHLNISTTIRLELVEVPLAQTSEIRTNKLTSAASTFINLAGSSSFLVPPTLAAADAFLPLAPLSSAFIASLRALRSTSFLGALEASERVLLSRDESAAASAAADAAAGGAGGVDAPSCRPEGWGSAMVAGV
jgi:hypothetical protein